MKFKSFLQSANVEHIFNIIKKTQRKSFWKMKKNHNLSPFYSLRKILLLLLHCLMEIIHE